MRNPVWMLVFLAPLALGCPKRSDDTGPGAHAASPVEAPPPGEPTSARPPSQAGRAAPAPDGQPAPQPPAGKGAPAGDLQAQEACVDSQLTQRGLNEYGDPADTLYAGGTPLFDERTGTTVSRLEYVYSKHPDIQKACALPAR